MNSIPNGQLSQTQLPLCKKWVSNLRNIMQFCITNSLSNWFFFLILENCWHHWNRVLWKTDISASLTYFNLYLEELFSSPYLVSQLHLICVMHHLFSFGDCGAKNNKNESLKWACSINKSALFGCDLQTVSIHNHKKYRFVSKKKKRFVSIWYIYLQVNCAHAAELILFVHYKA